MSARSPGHRLRTRAPRGWASQRRSPEPVTWAPHDSPSQTHGCVRACQEHCGPDPRSDDDGTRRNGRHDARRRRRRRGDRLREGSLYLLLARTTRASARRSRPGAVSAGEVPIDATTAAARRRRITAGANRFRWREDLREHGWSKSTAPSARPGPPSAAVPPRSGCGRLGVVDRALEASPGAVDAPSEAGQRERSGPGSRAPRRPRRCCPSLDPTDARTGAGRSASTWTPAGQHHDDEAIAQGRAAPPRPARRDGAGDLPAGPAGRRWHHRRAIAPAAARPRRTRIATGVVRAPVVAMTRAGVLTVRLARFLAVALRRLGQRLGGGTAAASVGDPARRAAITPVVGARRAGRRGPRCPPGPRSGSPSRLRPSAIQRHRRHLLAGPDGRQHHPGRRRGRRCSGLRVATARWRAAAALTGATPSRAVSAGRGHTGAARLRATSGPCGHDRRGAHVGARAPRWGSGSCGVERVRWSGQRALRMSSTRSLASPKSIWVFSLKNSGFCTPA